MKSIKIAYITETSPDDKHAWSGTVHYVYEALKKAGFTIEALGPASPIFVKYMLAIFNKISLFIFKKRIDYRHSKLYSFALGRIFNAKLKTADADVIVVCGGTEYGAYLVTSKPIYYVLDRTIEGALNYHTILSSLWEFSKKQSVYTDKKAMLESKKVFFSSQWAADHAIKNYGLTLSKIKVLPFGANMDKVPERSEIKKRDIRSQQRLLLIGTYWKNKGADIAFNALLHLLKNNFNASLTVVGCLPPEDLKHPKLTVIPFVDKNSNEGIHQLNELLSNHDFFILPTRFDCTPIVFCEASAFGLPILSANTGGVEGHIRDGKNGYLIPYEDKGEAYAEKIMWLVNTPEVYEQLCLSARQCYDTELNWSSWVTTFIKEIEN